MPSSLYHKYYDAIYQNKDYKKETNLVFNLSRKFGIKSPQKILEIGCGTGNHTRLLSKKGINLVAIDTDLEMVKIAKKKLGDSPNVKILHTPVESLKERNFDLAIAMFNVVTYITDTEGLHSFMRGVSRVLGKGSIFVFDMWNGVAAIKDPPGSKNTSLKYKGKTINCKLTSKTDFFNQTTTLNYFIKATDDERTEKGDFSFTQTLWTPMQVRSAFQEAGLEEVLCSPLLQPNKKATASDWKIMFCCRRSKGPSSED